MKKYIVFFIILSLNPRIFAQVKDNFAEIGNKSPAVRTNLLVKSIPPPLPDIQLPFSAGGKKSFKPMSRMDSPEKLMASLKEKRAAFLPFLRNLAPVVKKRPSIELQDFNWRIETLADKTDFESVIHGAGNWQKVQVPHYGPPLGKAITYYQTKFTVDDLSRINESLFICFGAVDYQAQVYVNGIFIGAHEGAFAPFEFEITSAARQGTNQLLIKVENDYPMPGHVDDQGLKLDGDKIYAATGPGYDDPVLGWHHCPPAMGIWQKVKIETRAKMHINDIFVRPLGNTDSAEVWLEINNTEALTKDISISYSLYGQNFSQTVTVNKIYIPRTVQIPGIGDLVKPTDWEDKRLKMGKGVNYLKFRIDIPQTKRWNPNTPWLYQLQISLIDEHGLPGDVKIQSFGMRSFRMDTTAIPKGGMYLNEQFIRLRGANTMGSFIQDVMRNDTSQLIDDILLAKIANINYIRMTQFPVQKEVYDYCDRLGMMTQSDLPLFGVLRRNKWAECIRQVEELERLVRSHPCNIIVTYINERFPNAEGNPQRGFDNYKDFEGFFTAADQAVHMCNPDRVIKAGDGDYDPPSPGLPDNHCYNGWYNGHGLGLGEMYKGYWLPVKPNWYYACGEFGSEGLDPLNTMMKYYPKAWLPATASDQYNWSPQSISMAQTYKFHYLWMNGQHSVSEWIKESQAHQAWVTRFTTESFRRNNNMVSFAIHLFIDAWPAGWMKSIMDVQRQPKPAYFEYAHALQPLAVSLRTDRLQYFSGEKISIESWISNDLNTDAAGSKLRYQFENKGLVVGYGFTSAKIAVNSSQFQGYISFKAPLVKQKTDFVLRLQLVDNQDKAIHETELNISIFPVNKPSNQLIWTNGGATGLGARLANQLGISITADPFKADVLIIDSLPAYLNQKGLIDQWVDRGKTAVFIQPDVGKLVIANDSVTIAATTMGQYYFVSPELENPLMKTFGPHDFQYWFNSYNNAISPILKEMSTIKGWSYLLKTGQATWTGNGSYAFAAAEKKYGKGRYRINHVLLDGRIKYNPVAKNYALHLLGLYKN